MSPRPQGIPYDHFKRAFDLVGASLVLVASLPIQAIVAIAIARRLGTPVLFRQQRPGLNGKIFTLIKFRTMRDVVPADDLVTDEQRLTPFGKRLRSFSLDELPTLVNVIKGDMSMVGPRPLGEEVCV
jgi:lipopolysaccharide/colanic/teichoic acid biosynthesis glycosyltransferase